MVWKHGLGSVEALPARAEDRKALFFAMARDQEAVMFRVATRLTGDPQRAEDLVRDTVLAAYAPFMEGKVTELKGFRAWILKVLSNLYLASRRKERRQVLTGDAFLEGATREQDSTDGELLRSTWNTKLSQALEALNPDQRLCVELVYVEQLEYEEAANILGIPIGTVRSRLSRARETMAKILESGGFNS